MPRTCPDFELYVFGRENREELMHFWITEICVWESLKAFEASGLWLKTCVFLLIILVIKLCILYFMHEMRMWALGTILTTTAETIFHFLGLFVVLKFFNEIKRNNPMATQIYEQPEESEELDENGSPKKNKAADAVWF